MTLKPDEAALIVGAIFSFLLSVAAAGRTYTILYDEQDKRYQRREVVKSGIIAFALGMIVSCLLVFVVPRFVD